MTCVLPANSDSALSKFSLYCRMATSSLLRQSYRSIPFEISNRKYLTKAVGKQQLISLVKINGDKLDPTNNDRDKEYFNVSIERIY